MSKKKMYYKISDEVKSLPYPLNWAMFVAMYKFKDPRFIEIKELYDKDPEGFTEQFETILEENKKIANKFRIMFLDVFKYGKSFEEISEETGMAVLRVRKNTIRSAKKMKNAVGEIIFGDVITNPEDDEE